MKDDSFVKNVVRYIYRRKKFFLYVLVLLLVLSYAVFGRKGILQRVELEMENSELKNKLKAEQEKTLMLQKEVEDLRTSDKKIEKVAREKYGMVKDGEEIYKVVTDSTK
jgi:cell division protein FtsB